MWEVDIKSIGDESIDNEYWKETEAIYPKPQPDSFVVKEMS